MRADLWGGPSTNCAHYHYRLWFISLRLESARSGPWHGPLYLEVERLDVSPLPIFRSLQRVDRSVAAVLPATYVCTPTTSLDIHMFTKLATCTHAPLQRMSGFCESWGVELICHTLHDG